MILSYYYRILSDHEGLVDHSKITTLAAEIPSFCLSIAICKLINPFPTTIGGGTACRDPSAREPGTY
jgi:hypothetical protein